MLGNLTNLEVSLISLVVWLWIVGGWSLLRTVGEAFKERSWGRTAKVFVWVFWPLIGTYKNFKAKD
jgi:hypothetical protein